MLPIYKATTFESRIEKGGRTRPIIVTVRNDKRELQQFVVKLYNKTEVQVNMALAKDILTVALINEFDLLTPQPALIRFDDAFMKTLPDELSKEIIQKEARLNFGCEYLSGTNNFGKNISKNTLEGLSGIDTVFAFDILVGNLDRRFVEKSNLLIRNHDIYLIDHEFCLSTNHGFESWESPLWTFPYHNHVFYPFLSGHNRQTIEGFFADFEELLKRLNVNVLDSYVEQIEKENFASPDIEILQKYLWNAKQNSHTFVNHLKGILQ
ncbi:hypothetical protein SAMN04515674_103378 [Pseudarcicella hirudinis]|uniref:HipA-like kinase domain-containing protein n=1 Tax=Pseudarcicella hirudinis TaxID=1079859 RepID=A0A1I5QV19_9BACT|nr:HipA family kinase [Pseudarcicella hirudinis]SFP50073.1 hypothetical protein SAMN04515674_103378 [Pseudarcicella hirudinis]